MLPNDDELHVELPCCRLNSNRSLAFALAFPVLAVTLAGNGLYADAACIMLEGLMVLSISATAPLHCAWHPAETITMTADGLRLTRSSAQSRATSWEMFEAVRIRRINPLDHEGFDDCVFRLTLINRYKPAISSFLHMKAADRVEFMFPIELALALPPDDAGLLVEQIDEWITEAELAAAAVNRQRHWLIAS